MKNQRRAPDSKIFASSLFYPTCPSGGAHSCQWMRKTPVLFSMLNLPQVEVERMDQAICEWSGQSRLMSMKWSPLQGLPVSSWGTPIYVSEPGLGANIKRSKLRSLALKQVPWSEPTECQASFLQNNKSMFGRLSKPGDICISEEELWSSTVPAPQSAVTLYVGSWYSQHVWPPEGTELFLDQESRPETPSSRKLNLLPCCPLLFI